MITQCIKKVARAQFFVARTCLNFLFTLWQCDVYFIGVNSIIQVKKIQNKRKVVFIYFIKIDLLVTLFSGGGVAYSPMGLIVYFNF